MRATAASLADWRYFALLALLPYQGILTPVRVIVTQSE